MEGPTAEESFLRMFSSTALANATNLEDITVNQSALPCSPKGCSKGADKMVSPGRVRTMKEYEEQMAELKKENFNLKLRIYFIEERQEQMKGLKDVDDLFKKNVELSCELETLKKDLSDKEELLLQSAKAVEILQNQHRKQIEDLKLSSARDKTYLEDHIANLQKILREKEQAINQFDDSSAMYAVAFGFNKGPDHIKEVENLKMELSNVTLRVVQLEEELQEEGKRYYNLKTDLEQALEESARLKNEVLSLETDIEKKDAHLQQAYLDLERKSEQLNALSLRIKKDKPKSEYIDDKGYKVTDYVEGKSGNADKKNSPQRGPSPSSRKSSVDSTSSNKDVCVRQRLRRDDKSLAKHLHDAHSKLTQLEDQTQIMQTKLHEAQLTCNNKDSDLSKLKEEHHKACVTIQALLKKNKVREKEFLLLQAEVEKKDKLIQEMSLPYKSFPQSDVCESGDNNENLREKFNLVQLKVKELTCEHNIAISEMEAQIQELKASLNEKELKLKEIEDKHNSGLATDGKDNRIAELESKLEEMKVKLQNIQYENKYEQANDEKLNSIQDEKLVQELESKKKEIEYLNSELRKRTFNLQELVNKELWDKNREIEKHNKLCERQQLEILQLKQQVAANEAQASFAREKLKDSGAFSSFMREVQIMNSEDMKENCSPVLIAGDDKTILREQLLHCWEEKKFLNKKVEELEERLQNMPERDSDSRLVQTLKSDLAQAKQDVEIAEKSRKEVIGACCLLINRLEELADFLDSLLPSLGAKKRRVVRHAVERSRELSKSFSAAADNTNSWEHLQPSLYTSLLPDFSTVDFWSGDDVTDLTLEEEANDEVDTIAQLRSELELVKEQLKQKDSELVRIHSQFTPSFQSMWSLGTNEFESINTENNSLAKLMSMFENLETNDNVHSNERGDNIDVFIPGKNNVLRNELKSSNIGEIVITSRKIASKDEKTNQNVGSESEAWSEPDRSVSLARIGLTDDTTLQQWLHDDSSDTTDNGHKTSPGSRKMKYGAGEFRRLQNKVRTLEEANEALRGELSILYKLAPPSLNSREDKSTSIDGNMVVSVPSNLLDEIRNQREKLESSLYHNDNIRRQLEGIFALLQVNEEEVSQLHQLKELKGELTDVKAQCAELETHCKTLEMQCLDLQEALCSEQAESNKKEEQCSDLVKEITALKDEQRIWKEKADSLQSEIDKLQSEYKLKCEEVSEKQSALIKYEDDAQIMCDTYEMKVKEAETHLKEERERWISAEAEFHMKIKALQHECNELKIQYKKFDEERNEIALQLKMYQSEGETSKEKLDELNSKLDECKTKEEKAKLSAEEWRKKCYSYQIDIEEVRSRLQGTERRLLEMEKINSELEVGLRGQVEAASKQCTQAEFLVKDLEMKHKTSALERVKNELERRVAELEAANGELETRLVTLQVTKLPSDSEAEEHDNALHFTSRKCIKWPSTSSSPPMSPSCKASSLHLPLSSGYKTQRSNDISSDYMSDQDNGQTCNTFWPQRSAVSASPDLGIESDQGRLSSLENQLQPLTISYKIDEGVSELAKLEEENLYLKQHLTRTRQALENTLSQLTAANHKKRQVERAICRQLGKTRLILKEARFNLEPDLDDGLS